jgi:hypothetical protein
MTRSDLFAGIFAAPLAYGVGGLCIRAMWALQGGHHQDFSVFPGFGADDGYVLWLMIGGWLAVLGLGFLAGVLISRVKRHRA